MVGEVYENCHMLQNYDRKKERKKEGNKERKKNEERERERSKQKGLRKNPNEKWEMRRKNTE